MAGPGDVIELAPGSYSPRTGVSVDVTSTDGTRSSSTTSLTMDGRHGSTDAPIVICGPKSAVIDGSSEDPPSSLLAIRHCSHVVLTGISFSNGDNGPMLQHVERSTVQGITVSRMEGSGIECDFCSRVNIRDSSVARVFRGVQLHESTLCTVDHVVIRFTAQVRATTPLSCGGLRSALSRTVQGGGQLWRPGSVGLTESVLARPLGVLLMRAGGREGAPQLDPQHRHRVQNHRHRAADQGLRGGRLRGHRHGQLDILWPGWQAARAGEQVRGAQVRHLPRGERQRSASSRTVPVRLCSGGVAGALPCALDDKIFAPG